MNKAKYILRFDDVCESMGWEIWKNVERILKVHDIKPIVAVVPKNQDPKLRVGADRSDFWDCVRNWQSLGWLIALHGYEHKYLTSKGGILGLSNKSEFAGLSKDVQKLKLKLGIEICLREDVVPRAFVAPSHSFDDITLDILPSVGIRVISDGLWPLPHTDLNGLTWLPCQLWDFARQKPGVWTICFHPNNWSPKALERFESNVKMFSKDIIDPNWAAQHYGHRAITLRDRLHASWNLFRYHRLRAILKQVSYTKSF